MGDYQTYCLHIYQTVKLVLAALEEIKLEMSVSSQHFKFRVPSHGLRAKKQKLERLDFEQTSKQTKKKHEDPNS